MSIPSRKLYSIVTLGDTTGLLLSLGLALLALSPQLSGMLTVFV